MLRKLGLTRQIILLTMTCVAGIVAVTLVYHTSFGRAENASKQAMAEVLERVAQNAAIRAELTSRQNVIQSLMRERDPDRLEQLMTSLEKSRINFSQRLGQRDEAVAVRAAADEWERFTAAAIEQVLMGNNAEAVTSFINDVVPRFEGLTSALDAYATAERDSVVALADEQRAANASLRNRVLIGSLAAGLVVGIAGVILPRRIARGLQRAIDELRAAAAQVNDAATQVSNAAQQTAQNTLVQASTLESTLRSIGDVSTMTESNSQASRQADDLAAHAQQDADRGNKTMQKLTSSIEAINESASEMSKIIRVIEEIAFQTNLLALNAAVEAARAGEHGKGFAVVAEEVRSLAMRSAEAAGSTSKLITESISRARDGATVCQGVGSDLAEIGTKVNSVAAILQQISQASDQQSGGVEQVRQSVGEIEKVTSQNAAVAEEAASAAEELTSMASMLKDRVVVEMSELVLGKGRSR